MPGEVPPPADYRVVAQVLAPHGVRGELKCRVVTDFPERFTPGARVFAGVPPRAHRITTARIAGPVVYLHLSGIGDRDAAEALRGTEVLVAPEDAVPLPEGQFYWNEVVGLRVEDTRGEALGSVVDILPTGGNDVYVVHGPLGEILVPAISDVVKEIAPREGRLVVELVPGLLPERRKPRRRRFARKRAPRG